MLPRLLRQGSRRPCPIHRRQEVRFIPACSPTDSSAYINSFSYGARYVTLVSNEPPTIDLWARSRRSEDEDPEETGFSPKDLRSEDVNSDNAIENGETASVIRRVATSKIPHSSSPRAWSQPERAPTALENVLLEMKSEELYVSPWLQEDHSSSDPPQQDITEARMAITQLLTEAEELDRDELMDKLWPILRQDGVIQSLPSTTFVEILRNIEPEDHFLPLGSPYAQRIPKFQKLLRGRMDREMQQMIHRRTIVMNICRMRLRRGRDFQRKEYAQILRCARNTYDGATASSVMWMMVNQNMELDASSYKCLLEAKCWSDAWLPFERYNLRLYPRGKAIRRSQRGESKIAGQLSLSPYKLGTGGLGKQVPKLVSRMIGSGIQADSDIIGYLITALARQGDITGVKVALRSAWDVDVDTLGTTYRYGRTLPADSPLYPNENSLFVIAHAFGSNNDVATALRVVDFVAGKFSIEITPAVWEELMEWSYVLSTPRAKKQWPEEMQPGQLPRRTPDDLWDLFTSKRYSCLPTLPMFDLKIRNSARRDTFRTFLHYAYEAMDELYKQQQLPAPDETAVELQDVKERASQQFLHFTYIQRWASLLLGGQRWRHGSNEHAWKQLHREYLPDIVDVFWRYRPTDGVSYTIDTGSVNLREWVEWPRGGASKVGALDAITHDERYHDDPASFSFTASFPLKT